jgi:hypothetical protein
VVAFETWSSEAPHVARRKQLSFSTNRRVQTLRASPQFQSYLIHMMLRLAIALGTKPEEWVMGTVARLRGDDAMNERIDVNPLGIEYESAAGGVHWRRRYPTGVPLAECLHPATRSMTRAFPAPGVRVIGAASRSVTRQATVLIGNTPGQSDGQRLPHRNLSAGVWALCHLYRVALGFGPSSESFQLLSCSFIGWAADGRDA